MDGAANGAGEGIAHEYAAVTDEADPEDGVLFDAIVVRYESDDDRCTLVPCEGSTAEKLNAWLSVNLQTVVDLEEAR